MSKKLPVLMVVFNRPELTKQIFEAVRNYKPSKLYIAADGARQNVESDFLKCKETRSIFDLIDWDCKVLRLFQNTNLGCGRGVSSAINWFFEQEEEGIILEDDCLPNDSFFTYCEDLIDYHRNNDKVMHIGGTNFQFGKHFGDTSYYYSSIPHVWGWATWRRAWKKYDFNLSDLNFFLNQNKIGNYISDKKVYDFWFEIFCKMNQKKIDTWDYQWQYAIWNNNGVSIIPQENLIKNIGFGADATHTKDTHMFANIPTKDLVVNKHPVNLNVNRDADNAFFNLSFK